MTLNISLPIIDGSVPLPLHAPDGFFSLPVAIAGYLLAAVFIGIAIRQTNKSLNERIVPMMGVMAAFIFAAQMLNFPVAGGTSGHLVGGALAAIVLGPWAAILVMTAVVGLQALLFQDGGLVVLGINLLNMSIVSVLAGYAAYWVSRKLGTTFKHLLVGSFIAAWLSVVASAATTALMLGMSGTTPLALALPAMIGVHMLIGIGEALITVFALSFIRAARPALLQMPDRAAVSDAPAAQLASSGGGGMGAYAGGSSAISSPSPLLCSRRLRPALLTGWSESPRTPASSSARRTRPTPSSPTMLCRASRTRALRQFWQA